MSDGGPRIRVLHLFSNCKWTGPAEPAVNLCVALRSLGIEADFACAPDAGSSVNMVVETARARGLDPNLDFRLRKHRHPLWNYVDARKLGKLLSTGRYDLVHCHLDNDHEIAASPARRHGIPLIRSSYEGEGLSPTRRHRKLLEATALLIEPSEIARANDAENFGLPSARARVVQGSVDIERFSPSRALPNARQPFGLPDDALVLGIVARMQTHRHYEDLLEAFAQVHAERPSTRLMVIGRGTKQEQVAREPVRRLGIQDAVVFTGYLDGDNYVAALAAFDIGVFLVPGSDGTCRAVREILAMGKPMVVSDRGMLRELVRHGREGLVCDGTPAGLRQWVALLCDDAPQRDAMGRAARERAVADFAPSVHAGAVAACYGCAMAARKE